MKMYRVDYVCKNGQRGIWHSEKECDLQDLIVECRSEYQHISKRLDHLEKLVIVQIIESDIMEMSQ